MYNIIGDSPVTQIIGHTPKDDITLVSDHIICVDCLLSTPKSWLIA